MWSQFSQQTVITSMQALQLCKISYTWHEYGEKILETNWLCIHVKMQYRDIMIKENNCICVMLSAADIVFNTSK